MSVSADTIGYWAGIFDGEGYIGALRAPGDRIRFRISLSNTNERLIDAARVELGMTKVLKYRKSNFHKQGYEAVADGSNAARICRIVLPHLRLKQKQAFLLLLPTYHRWLKLTREEKTLRHTAAELLRRLNRKGARE